MLRPAPAGGANSAPQTWLDFREKKREKGREREREGKERARGKKGKGNKREKEKGTKEREGERKREMKEERKGRNLCSCDFSLGKTHCYAQFILLLTYLQCRPTYRRAFLR